MINAELLRNEGILVARPVDKPENADSGRVAAVTGSGFLTILPKIADYFVSADVRHFDYEERGKALN